MANEAKCAKCSIDIAMNGIWGGVVYCVGCQPMNEYAVGKGSVLTPEFKNEAEEAAWWDSHPDEILRVFEQAAKEKCNASIQR